MHAGSYVCVRDRESCRAHGIPEHNYQEHVLSNYQDKTLTVQ